MIHISKPQVIYFYSYECSCQNIRYEQENNISNKERNIYMKLHYYNLIKGHK